MMISRVTVDIPKSRAARQIAAARTAAAEGVRRSGEKVTVAMVEAGQAVHGCLFTEAAVVEIYLAMRGAK